LPRKTAREQTLDDRAIADLSTNVTIKQRDRIIKLLLDGKSQDDVCEELNLTHVQVADVADSIKVQLAEAERKRTNELRTLLLNGSAKAFKLLIKRLDDEDFPTKMLPASAGVLFDKWLLLAGSTSTSQSLVVSGSANLDDLLKNAVGVVSRITNRAGVEPTEQRFEYEVPDEE